MKRLLSMVIVVLLLPSLLWAPPVSNGGFAVVSSAPSGHCTSNEIRYVKTTGATYYCSGSWTSSPSNGASLNTVSTHVARDSNGGFSAGAVTVTSLTVTPGADGTRYVSFAGNTVNISSSIAAGTAVLFGKGASGIERPVWGNNTKGGSSTAGYPIVVSGGSATTSGPSAWAKDATSCDTACNAMLGGTAASGHCIGSYTLDGNNTHSTDCTVTSGARLCECF